MNLEALDRLPWIKGHDYVSGRDDEVLPERARSTARELIEFLQSKLTGGSRETVAIGNYEYMLIHYDVIRFPIRSEAGSA